MNYPNFLRPTNPPLSNQQPKNYQRSVYSPPINQQYNYNQNLYQNYTISPPQYQMMSYMQAQQPNQSIYHQEDLYSPNIIQNQIKPSSKNQLNKEKKGKKENNINLLSSQQKQINSISTNFSNQKTIPINTTTDNFQLKSNQNLNDSLNPPGCFNIVKRGSLPGIFFNQICTL